MLNEASKYMKHKTDKTKGKRIQFYNYTWRFSHAFQGN